MWLRAWELLPASALAILTRVSSLRVPIERKNFLHACRALPLCADEKFIPISPFSFFFSSLFLRVRLREVLGEGSTLPSFHRLHWRFEGFLPPSDGYRRIPTSACTRVDCEVFTSSSSVCSSRRGSRKASRKARREAQSLEKERDDDECLCDCMHVGGNSSW